MSRLHKEDIRDILQRFLISLLAGAGLGLCLINVLYQQVDVAAVATLCAITAAGMTLAGSLRRWGGGALALTGVALLALGLAGVGPLVAHVQPLRALWYYPGNMSIVLLPYRQTLTQLIAVALTVLAGLAALSEECGGLLALTAAVLLPSCLLGTGEAPILYGGLAAAAILLHAAGRHTARSLFPTPLLLTALLLVVALLMTPAKVTPDETLSRAADELYEILQDYLPEDDNGKRPGFTLRTDGYMPLSTDEQERLGGRPQPEQYTVMEVETDRAVYLRGVAKNEYDGTNWYDTLGRQRHLWSDVFEQALKRSVFDEYLPLTEGELPLSMLKVRMLRDGTTTVFVPQRLRELTTGSARMVAYYNAGSEVFLARSLQAGDTYQATYLPLSADSEQTAALVSASAQWNDTRYSEVARQYLGVPSFIQQEVYEMSMAAAGGEEDPYLRALSIRDWLKENYAYSLEVSDPPQNQDFVAWFLIRERKGYCTYFASAMTVLCRIQGIPARYVTGYIARPDETGHALVTGEHAHAWTEVYLNGFGWLTLDATPGFGNMSDDGPGPEPEGHGGESDQEDEEPGEQPAPDEPDEEERELPPDQENDEGDQENFPDSTDDSADNSDLPDEPLPLMPPQQPVLWPFALLVVLAVLIGARLYRTEPVRLAARRPERAMDTLLNATLCLLGQCGIRREASETLRDYADRVHDRFPEANVREQMDRYEAALYGERPFEERPAVDCYRAIRARVIPLRRMGLRLRYAFTCSRGKSGNRTKGVHHGKRTRGHSE